MGRIYHPKNKIRAKGNLGHNFEVNFCGADILGHIMKAVGFHSLSIERHHRKIAKMLHPSLNGHHCLPPSTRFKMTAKETSDAAKRIFDLSERKKAALYETCNGYYWDGSRKEFDKFIEEWAIFLETCRGYEALG